MKHGNHRSVPFRVAILGAGGIAEVHAAILSSLPDVNLFAICDCQESKAAAFGQKLGIGGVYGSLEALLRDGRPDIVHIAVPAAAHAVTATACLDAGSSVFIEKPFCVSSEECRQIATAAARSGGYVGVNHNMAFHPAVMRAIGAVADRRVGAIEHATVCLNVASPHVFSGPYTHWMFQATGNIMFELGAHPLSVVQRLFGRVVSARSLPAGRMVLPTGTVFYPSWQISMECERGTAHVFLSVATGFTDMWVRIQGEDGICHADVRRNTVFLSEKSSMMRPNDDLRDALQASFSVARDGLRAYQKYILSSMRRKVPYPASFEAMNSSIGAFYRALRNGRKPPMSVAEGTAVVEACEAAIAGAETAAPAMTAV